MKKIIHTLLPLLILGTISCSKSSDNEPAPTPVPPFEVNPPEDFKEDPDDPNKDPDDPEDPDDPNKDPDDPEDPDDPNKNPDPDEPSGGIDPSVGNWQESPEDFGGSAF